MKKSTLSNRAKLESLTSYLFELGDDLDLRFRLRRHREVSLLRLHYLARRRENPSLPLKGNPSF